MGKISILLTQINRKTIAVSEKSCNFVNRKGKLIPPVAGGFRLNVKRNKMKIQNLTIEKFRLFGWVCATATLVVLCCVALTYVAGAFHAGETAGVVENLAFMVAFAAGWIYTIAQAVETGERIRQIKWYANRK